MNKPMSPRAQVMKLERMGYNFSITCRKDGVGEEFGIGFEEFSLSGAISLLYDDVIDHEEYAAVEKKLDEGYRA